MGLVGLCEGLGMFCLMLMGFVIVVEWLVVIEDDGVE